MPFPKRKPINLKRWEDEKLGDFEISPDLYTHLTIIEALQAVPKGLESSNADGGLVALNIAVDQLEQILRARKLLFEDSEYYTKVKEHRDTLEKGDFKNNPIMLQGKLANFKLGLLLEFIFGTTTRDVGLTL